MPTKKKKTFYDYDAVDKIVCKLYGNACKVGAGDGITLHSTHSKFNNEYY